MRPFSTMSRTQGLITACPAEKSGDPQAGAPEFQFEYGSDYVRHIEQFDPTFCKVLVRDNPGGDRAMNRRQASRLRQLSDYLHGSGRMFMFELLVPPNPAQLQRLGNDKNAYDVQLRPTLTVQAIHELQDSGVEADVWKIEGFQRKEDCQRVVAAARRVGRDTVSCIILGRHEDAGTMYPWSTELLRGRCRPHGAESPWARRSRCASGSVAAGVPGYIGFAVGRTTFWDPLVNYRAERTRATPPLSGSPLPTGRGWTCSREKNKMSDFAEQLQKMKTQPGFIAALDQSGGSTPKALRSYGIPDGAWSNEEEMFAIVHQMRTRIITSPCFTGQRILGAILFENTMDREIEGRPSADYLWNVKRVVPFLKVDKGLAAERDGVHLMKPMPELDALLDKAKAKRIFGTKMRSVINQADRRASRTS